MALLTRRACHGFQASGSELLLPRPGWRCRRAGFKAPLPPLGGGVRVLHSRASVSSMRKRPGKLPRPALGE